MNLASLSLAALLLLSPAVARALEAAPEAPAPSATRGRKTGREVKLFLIAIDDGGRSGRKVGCNDSVVAVRRVVPRTGTPLRAALEELLRVPAKSGPAQQTYNALYQPKLKVERVSVRRGEAVVHLSGLLVTGGVCDAPRVQAQLEETARQFPTVRRVKVYVNGTPLADYLSERG